MPLPDIDCSMDESVCCPSMFDYGKYMLDTAWAGIAGCLSEDCQKDYEQYVTMGQGSDGLSDVLSVSILRVGPSPKSTDNNGRLMQVSLQRAVYDIRLRESNWPIVSAAGGVINAPSSAAQQAVARHAYSHGEKMYRSLLALTRGMTWTGSYPRPTFFTLSALQPINPAGGIAGWFCTAEVDMPWGIAGF